MKFVSVKDNYCFRAKIVSEILEEFPEKHKGEYRYFSLIDLFEADFFYDENNFVLDDVVYEIDSLQQRVEDNFSITNIINE